MASDTYFKFGNEKVPAHKLILASLSTKFNDLYFGVENNYKPAEIDIKTKDDVQHFKVFLCLFYSKKVIVTNLNVKRLLEWSLGYKVSYGIYICSDFIRLHGEHEKLFQYYDLAYNHVQLKEQLKKQICNDFARVFHADNISLCDKGRLEDILKTFDGNYSPETIFAGCISWAFNLLKKRGKRLFYIGEDYRKELGNCLYYIPFQQMTVEEFNKIRDKYPGLLNIDERKGINLWMKCGELTESGAKFADYFDYEKCLCCSRDPVAEQIIKENETIFTSDVKLLCGGFKLVPITNIKFNFVLEITVNENKIKRTIQPNQKIEPIWLAKPFEVIPGNIYNIKIKYNPSKVFGKANEDEDSNESAEGKRPTVKSAFDRNEFSLGGGTITFHDDVSESGMQCGILFSMVKEIYFNRI